MLENVYRLVVGEGKWGQISKCLYQDIAYTEVQVLTENAEISR